MLNTGQEVSFKRFFLLYQHLCPTTLPLLSILAAFLQMLQKPGEKQGISQVCNSNIKAGEKSSSTFGIYKTPKQSFYQ